MVWLTINGIYRESCMFKEMTKNRKDLVQGNEQFKRKGKEHEKSIFRNT